MKETSIDTKGKAPLEAMGEAWSGRMEELDPSYRRWKENYEGQDPIWRVKPVKDIGGQPTGYASAPFKEAAEFWGWAVTATEKGTSVWKMRFKD